ncbi:unnamed protein product [Sympodiomycopsis kandeliae]
MVSDGHRQDHNDEKPSRHAWGNADQDHEQLLWLLSDSNLPTGGFVASAGLESFFAHGFLHDVGLPAISTASTSGNTPSNKATSSSRSQGDQMAASTASFLYLSLSSYARTAVPFITDVHRITIRHLSSQDEDSLETVDDCIATVMRLDDAYHSMILNHVLRRASKAQGIALLTLYSKSFAEKVDTDSLWDSNESEKDNNNETDATRREEQAANLISELKRRIRVAAPRDEPPYGHLPICWSVFCAALQVPIESTIKLHLFLQARAILSSSIRLNTLGPYLAHSMLHHQVKRVLADILQSKDWIDGATVGLDSQSDKLAQKTDKAFEWNWPKEASWSADEEQHSWNLIAPANTWPLGEIIQARHDSLHSRLFNS